MKASEPKLIKLVSAPTDDPKDSGRRPGRICYVDDSRTSAYVTRKILTEFGYQVDHFGSAEPAVVALLGNDYDLLLTDLLLSTGGMNGDDLVRFLRLSGHPKKKLLPVIVITGTSDKDTLLRIYEAGANGVLVKPITGDELNERIRGLLPEKRLINTDSGYAIEIHDAPHLSPDSSTQRARPAVPAVQSVPHVPQPSASTTLNDAAAASNPLDALSHQSRKTQQTEADDLAHDAKKRPVTAFGATKRPSQQGKDAPRDASSVIAELRQRSHEEGEEDIPTLTLTLDEMASDPVHIKDKRAAYEAVTPEETLTLAVAPQKTAQPTPISSKPKARVSQTEAKPRVAKAETVRPPVEEPEVTPDSKAIVTALDIEQDFQDIDNDFNSSSMGGNLIDTLKRYKILSVAALASLLIIGWSLVSFMRSGNTVTVETVHAQVGALHQTVSVPGKVVSKLKVDISANTSGQVKQILVKEGDKVIKGQNLAQIDSDELASEVKRAEGNLLSAQEESALAEKTVIRMRRALELGAVSRQAVEEAEAGLKSAKAKEAVVKEDVRSARLLADKLNIIAPFDGTITAKLAQVGQHVNPSEVMFSIVDMGQREIEVKADAADSSAISVGQEVEVSSDAFPGRKWTETVTHVATSANRENTANTVSISISLGRQAPALKVGQQVDAEIRVATNANTVKLPIGTLIQRNGKTWVTVVEDGRVHYVVVETGIEDLTHVEITEGIKRGEQIILPKGVNLREGDRVIVGSSRSE